MALLRPCALRRAICTGVRCGNICALRPAYCDCAIDPSSFTSVFMRQEPPWVLGVLGCVDYFTRPNFCDLRTGRIFCTLHIVISLQIQPELMRGAKKTRETKRCVRSNTASTARNLI